MIPKGVVADYGGGPFTALASVGNMIYGMVASATFTGKDAPFVYNGVSGTFTAISGLSAGLLPTSQPTTGDWTPPTIAEVTSRVVFTHPGFAGGLTLPTSFQLFSGGLTSGSSTVNGPYAYSAPVGTIIEDSGGGIPANTTIQNTIATEVVTAATGNPGATSILVASTSGIVVGDAAFGPGLAGIVSAISGSNVSFNSALTQTMAGAQVSFQGTNIIMSQTATATTAGSNIFAWSPTTVKFGWLDIGGFSAANIIGNTIANAPAITGSPNITGVQPGMTISGPGIAAGTVVNGTINTVFNISALTVTGSPTIQLTTGFTQYAIGVGQTVSGLGVPPNTTVLTFNVAGFSVTLTQAITAGSGGAGIPLTLAGAQILMSQNATTSANGVALTIAGGTAAAPLWGAGDLSVYPIASSTPPVFVAQYSNRAYYGVNTPNSAAVQASDAGSAAIQSNISQTLVFHNGIPVTAAAGLGLSNQLGGIVQSLMVFQGDSNIQQITGDFASQNIAVNPLQTATGTLAPNSIASTPKGLMFVASDGLRLIDFNGNVSDPIGTYGKGISLPFINAVLYSRIAAAYNENVYRVTVSWIPPQTVASVWGTSQRMDEFWFHADVGKWSGPHTSIMDMIVPLPAGNTFIGVAHNPPASIPGFVLTDDAGFTLTDDTGVVVTDDSGGSAIAAAAALFRSDVNPSSITIYTELGTPLTCAFTTALMPDNPGQMAIGMSQTTIMVGMRSGEQELLMTATDDMGQTLSRAYVVIGPFSAPAQRPIPWTSPLVFRQLRLSLTATASSTLQLGAINLRDEVLGYQLPYPVAQEWILGQVMTGGVLGP
jgi:hypothetical protein